MLLSMIVIVKQKRSALYAGLHRNHAKNIMIKVLKVYYYSTAQILILPIAGV